MKNNLKSNPVISVIMPVYNGGKFLAESIESILRQTFTNFELIIVNDSSTDNTVDIINSFSENDNRIKFYNNEFSKGIHGGLNTALKYAAGKYIAIANADDIDKETRFEEEYNFLENHEEVAVVGGGCVVFNEAGNRKILYSPASSLELAWRFVSNIFFCNPSVMFRSDIISAVGNYPVVVCEDFAFLSKVIKKFKGYNLKRILLDYREHPSNYSSSFRVSIFASVKNIFLENYKFYLDNVDNAEIFFEFQNQGVLELRNFFKVASINKKILKRISENYQVSLFSFGALILLLKIFYLQIRALVKFYYKKIKK